MKIDFSPRRSGKTTRLIEWLKGDPGRLMVVFSNEEENRLKREHPEVGTQIVDWDSYHRAHPSSYFKEVSIDNLDLILRRQFSQSIKIITLSDEDTTNGDTHTPQGK